MEVTISVGTSHKRGMIRDIEFCEKLKETNNPAELKWIARDIPRGPESGCREYTRYPFKISIEL